MSPRQALRALVDHLLGNAFERRLRGAARTRRTEVVFAWNRGLGDIPLGLLPLFAQVRAAKPAARIVVVTRADLAQAMALAGADRVVAVPGLTRGAPLNLRAVAPSLGLALGDAAAVFADPDPDRWLRSRAPFAPVLRWNRADDARAARFIDPHDARPCIGIHAASETARHYRYAKDWPAEHWARLFGLVDARVPVRWVIVGHAPSPPLRGANVLDLRGRTDLLDMLAVIRRCRAVVAPDSGVLSTVYYLDAPADLLVVSLWADPRQGVLKQGSASPNPGLVHRPLLGRGEDVTRVSPEAVADCLCEALVPSAATA